MYPAKKHCGFSNAFTMAALLSLENGFTCKSYDRKRKWEEGRWEGDRQTDKDRQRQSDTGDRQTQTGRDKDRDRSTQSSTSTHMVTQDGWRDRQRDTQRLIHNK